MHVYFNTSYFNMFFAALEFSQREVGNKDPMRQFCFHGSQQRLATAEFQHVLFCKFLWKTTTFCCRQHEMFCTPQPFRQQVNQHRLLQKISNMAETQGPRMVYAKINKTLAEIGLNVQQVIIASPVANCQSQQPDDFHQTMVDNNKSTWWLVVTAEELNKLAPIAGTTARVINSLPGNLRMDSFDKVILSPSPTGAVTTMFYHLVEQHVSTREPNRFHLVAFNPDFQQTMLRLSLPANRCGKSGQQMTGPLSRQCMTHSTGGPTTSGPTTLPSTLLKSLRLTTHPGEQQSRHWHTAAFSR